MHAEGWHAWFCHNLQLVCVWTVTWLDLDWRLSLLHVVSSPHLVGQMAARRTEMFPSPQVGLVESRDLPTSVFPSLPDVPASL